MRTRRYPKIDIRSKNELAKRLCTPKFTVEKAAELINDVLANYDAYWKDHKKLSRPDSGKWVRDASYTNLGRLLRLVNSEVLAPHDHMIPDFLFGGISGRSHKAAVQHLLGRKRERVLLKLDISRFYERISQERVEQFFALKAGCGGKGAKMLAGLCCVAFGAKSNPEDHKTLARGFSTSSRLAVWCNLDNFIKLDRLIKKELRGKDPRIAIYVDDIGITASRVTKEEMMGLYPKIKDILESDPKQPLPLNTKKTRIVFHDGQTYTIEGESLGKQSFEHLGLQMLRNAVTLGTRTRWKMAELTHRIKTARNKASGLKKSKKSLMRYREYIHK